MAEGSGEPYSGGGPDLLGFDVRCGYCDGFATDDMEQLRRHMTTKHTEEMY